MLILFFSIVFIAELIITIELIRFIRKFDNTVIEFNERLTSVKPGIIKSLKAVRVAVSKMLFEVTKFQLKFEKQKEKFKNNILKNIITVLLFVVLHKNGKQALALVDLAFSIKGFIESFKLVLNRC